AKALAATGRPRALSAMSMTAAMARTPLRGRRGMRYLRVGRGRPKVQWYYQMRGLVGAPFPSRPRRTKTPVAPLCFIETCNFANHGLQCSREHELRNPGAALDCE